jgi:hypothetical protein
MLYEMCLLRWEVGGEKYAQNITAYCRNNASKKSVDVDDDDNGPPKNGDVTVALLQSGC